MSDTEETPMLPPDRATRRAEICLADMKRWQKHDRAWAQHCYDEMVEYLRMAEASGAKFVIEGGK